MKINIYHVKSWDSNAKEAIKNMKYQWAQEQ